MIGCPTMVRDEELAIQSKQLGYAYADYQSVLLQNSFAQTASLTLTWHFSVITRLDIALRPRFRRFSINSEKCPANSGTTNRAGSDRLRFPKHNLVIPFITRPSPHLHSIDLHDRPELRL